VKAGRRRIEGDPYFLSILLAGWKNGGRGATYGFQDAHALQDADHGGGRQL
jgi:hypothetical protein